MIRLTIERPNTVGVTYTREFDTPAETEAFVERRCERLSDKWWNLSEWVGSNSLHGLIRCSHDLEADVMLISWRTLQ